MTSFRVSEVVVGGGILSGERAGLAVMMEIATLMAHAGGCCSWRRPSMPRLMRGFPLSGKLFSFRFFHIRYLFDSRHCVLSKGPAGILCIPRYRSLFSPLPRILYLRPIHQAAICTGRPTWMAALSRAFDLGHPSAVCGRRRAGRGHGWERGRRSVCDRLETFSLCKHFLRNLLNFLL